MYQPFKPFHILMRKTTDTLTDVALTSHNMAFVYLSLLRGQIYTIH